MQSAARVADGMRSAAEELAQAGGVIDELPEGKLVDAVPRHLPGAD